MAVMDVRIDARDRGRSSRRVFTLVEAVVSIVVVGVMLVAALETLGAVAKTTMLQSGWSRADILAHDLMNEILQARYQEPDNSTISLDSGGMIVSGRQGVLTRLFGPEADELDGTRTAFDDVDDYYGWSSTPPTSKNGVALSSYAGWTRASSVQFVQMGTLTKLGRLLTFESGLKQITVTVSDPDGEQTTLCALRSSAGLYEYEPADEITYISWVGVRLQVGADADPLVGGAVIVNEVPTGP